MKVLRLIHFLLFVLLLAPGVEAALPVDQPNFRHYTIQEGLSVNAVYSITQDSKGFLWFGTIDGLNRFDGRHIKTYRLTADEQPRIRLGSIIYALCEDRNRQLWIASDRGIALFDLKTERFLPFDLKTRPGGVSINTRASSVLMDKEGRIWMGVFGQGLFCYTPGTGQLEQFMHRPGHPQSLASNNVRRLYQDAAGVLWLSYTDCGIARFHADKRCFSNYPLTDAALPNEALFEDSQGTFWVGNDTRGLIRFDRQTGHTTYYLTPESAHYARHIRGIVEYAPGTLIIASDTGLTLFDTQTGTARATLTANREGSRGLNDSYLHSLYIDRERGLWVGTYFGGVNYLSLNNNTNFTNYTYSLAGNSIPGKIVSAFCEDPDGNLWIGTDDAGLSHLNRTTRHFTNYRPEKGRNSLSYQNIHALLCHEGGLWIGTYTGGLDRLDLRTGQFRNYRSSNDSTALCASSVYALYEDNRGALWVGTTLGLNRYNPQTDNFTRFPVLAGCDVTRIIEDKQGHLWVATFGDGIFQLNIRTGEWKRFTQAEHGLTNDKVVTFCLDDVDRLWVGTDGGGLCRFDYATVRFLPVVHPDFTSNVIHRIIADYDYLWISTNKGLLKYHPDKHTVKVYNQYDGLPGDQFTPNTGLKTRDGRLWFGGINGFASFLPNELKENRQQPAVVLTDLSVLNVPVRPGDPGSPLTNSIGYTNELTLSHRQSIFSLEFVALSFTAPLKNRYHYRLVGFDKEWQSISGDPRVSYMNLPPGTYRFLVRASNGDDVWTADTELLTLTILPPFWRSMWAYLLYIVLLLSGVVGSIYYLMRRTRRLHRIKLQELEVSKEKELYTAKTNFFTNIVHEIRTPLTLIIGPLESIMKSAKSMDQVQGELTVIARNSNRLLTLVNQLMDFRKIEAEGFLLRNERHDVTALVRQVCANFAQAGRQCKAEITFDFPALPCPSNVDAEAMEKIVTNLFMNAMKYTLDRIKVSVIRHEGTRMVDIIIADNGCGIPTESITKIFEPFYQVREAQQAATPGTGIGLTLARSLTEAMGGRLLVESTPGQGSTFTVQLSLLPDEEVAPLPTPVVAVEAPAPEQEPTDSEAFTIPTLLIIDDNEELRTFLQQQLASQYHIVLADSGEEALAMLATHRVNLIVSDVMMPGMDGFELSRRVKQELETSHIPLILLTARANIDAKIEGLETGADVYIEKPFSVDFLCAQINSLLLNRDKLRQRFINQPFVSSVTIATSRADRELLAKMDAVIAQNLAEPEFSIDHLAGELCMSRSTLFEKIKNVSGLTPNNYIRLTRLKKAAEYLSAGEYQINEVCYLVGFSSSSYFTKCFKKQFGVLPTEFTGQRE